MILSCGEALIDFIPARAEAGAYLPRPGGSPYNVAVALGRLGVPSGFAGGISTDFFGDQLVASLRESGVSTNHMTRLDRPSTLAFASLDAAEPRYAFYDAEAADRHWRLPGDALPGAGIDAVHCGSLALVRPPAAAAFETLLLGAHVAGLVVSLDPNIRAEHIGDAAGHRARLGLLAAAADIVKLSLADLAWMAPGAAPDDFAASLVGNGPSLVVISAGAQGATAYAHAGKVSGAAEKVAVVDTVGAGDAFMAGLLAGLWDGGDLTRSALARLPEVALAKALRLALSVAALTCTRPGADPPWRRELAEPGNERSHA